MLGLATLQRFRWKGARLGRRCVVAACISIAATAAARAQCLPFDQRMPSDDLEMFKVDPGSTLNSARNDNSRIASRIAGYIATDPKLLDKVRKLLADVPSVMKPAIGAGLRRAEMQCTNAQMPRAAKDIETYVRNLGDHAVTAGYVAETEQPEFDPSNPSGGKTTAGAARRKGDASSLLSGEWNTEIADPFAAVPIPLMPNSPQ